MRKYVRLLILVAAMALPWATNAQTLVDYTFSTGVNTARWVTLTSYNNLSASVNADSWASLVQNIGFTFPFCENTYTQYSVNSDGNLRLGSTVTGTGSYSTPFSSTAANTNSPKINFFGCDGYLCSSYGHYVHSQLFGDTMLVVEFNIGPYNNTYRTSQFKWQVHLYSNGNIEVVFGDNDGQTTNYTHQMGLCLNASDGFIITSANASIHFTAGNSTYWSTTLWPEEGRYYCYSRPSITCPAPQSITVGNITSNSATVHFTPAGTESAWIGSITPSIMGYNTISLTDTTANLAMLSPNTEYTVSVRAICGAGDTSQARTTTFRTACGTLSASDLPLLENFDSYTGGSANPISPCWTKGTNYSTAFPYPTTTAAINGTLGLYFYSNHSTSATSYYSYAALPQLGSTLNASNMTLRFNAKRYSATAATYRSLIQIGVMTDPTDISTFTLVGTADLTHETASSTHFFEFDFSSYAGTGKYIALYAPVIDTTGTATNYISIDDVELLATPTCRRPFNLAASNVTAHTADISWATNDNAHNTFVLAYGAGNDPSLMAQTTVTGTSTTLQYLVADSRYNMFVKAACSSSDHSEWSPMGSFITDIDCAVGYQQANALIGNGTTASSYYAFYTSISTIAGTSQAIYTYDEIAATASLYPENNLLKRIRLHVGTTGGTIHGAHIYMKNVSRDHFATTADTNAVADMQEVFSGTIHCTATEWVDIQLTTPFAYNVDSNLTITFRRDSVCTEGAVNFYYTNSNNIYRNTYGYRSSNSFSSNSVYYRPDIELQFCTQVPSCPPLYSVTVSSITATFANVNLEPDSETQNRFQVAYGTVDNLDSMAFKNVAYNFGTTLLDLLPNTQYFVRARAVCGAGDTSAWSRTISFTTLCATAPTPLFSETFDALSDNAIPQCWSMGWFYQNPTSGVKSQPFTSGTSYRIGSTGRAMYLQDQGDGTLSYLSTQKLPFDQSGKYTLSVWIYRNSSYSTKTREGLKFWVSDYPNDTTGATLLGYVHRFYMYAPTEANANQWYNYQFEIPASTDKFILIEGISEYGAATYFDNLEVIYTDCRKDVHYAENFELQDADKVPVCWDNSASTTSTVNGSNPERVWGNYFTGGSKMLRMYNYLVQNGTALINSPVILLDDTARVLRYDYAHQANCGDAYVKISNNGGVSFTTVDTISSNASSYSYSAPINMQTRQVDLSSYVGDSIIVQFFANANYGSGAIFVDNVEIRKGNSCAEPLWMTAFSLSPTGIGLDWEAGDSTQHSFTIAYGTTDNLSSMTQVNVSNQNYYDLLGLTSSTTYYIYIRSNCGTESSYWYGPVAFSTSCNAYNVTATAPFIEDFETTSQTRYCWEINNSGANNFTLYTSFNSTPAIGSYCVGSTGSNDEGNTASIYTPWLYFDNYDNGVDLSFKYLNPDWGGDQSELYVSYTLNGYIWATLGTLDTNASNWTEVHYTIPSGSCGSFMRFRFDHIDHYGHGVALDDVQVSLSDNCAPVTNAYVASRTHNSIYFIWEPADSTQTNYNFAWGTTDDISTMARGSLSGFFDATISGLNPDTYYYIYIQTNCGSSVSSWYGPISIKTLCAPFVIDDTTSFLEGFDYNSTSAQCWTISSSGASNFSYYTTFNGIPAIGDRCVASTGTSYEGNSAYLYSPWFHFDDTTRGAFLSYSLLNPAWGEDQNYLYIWYKSSPNSPYILLASHGQDVSTWTQNSIYIAPEDLTSDMMFLFGHYDYYGHGVALDNIGVSLAPNCMPARYLSAYNVGDNSATLFWQPMDSTQHSFTLAYGTGTDPDSMATINVTGNYVTLSGLASGTGYNVFIRTNCSATETSTWSDPYHFNTSFCPFDDQCIFTISMFDSYGDGWNGAYLSVVDSATGVTVTTAAGTGDTSHAVFRVCPGRTYQLYWTSGYYDSECSFTVANGSGQPVYTSSTLSQGLLTTFTATCGDPCASISYWTQNDVRDNIVTLSWLPQDSTQHVFTIAYGTSDNLDSATFLNVVGTSATFTLMPGTRYYFYVRAVCGSSRSAWLGPITSLTGCLPFEVTDSTPYLSNWEDASTTSCLRVSGSNPFYISHGLNGIPAIDSLCSVSYGVSGNGDINYIYTPWLHLSDTTRGVYFEYSYANPARDSNQNQLMAWYRTDNGQWTIVGNHCENVTSWTRHSAYISPEELTSDYIQIQFGHRDNYGYGVAIDDVSVSLAPSCLPVTDVAVTNVTDAAATVSWQPYDGTQSNFTVAYGTGTDPSAMTYVAATGNSVTLSGLASGTDYHVFVRANCSSQSSRWSTPAEFHTANCGTLNQCSLTVILHDSYGDGWNGAYLNFVDSTDNSTIAHLSLPIGIFDDTLSLTVCNGHAYQLSWVSGMFDNECSFSVLDHDGLLLYASGTLSGGLLANVTASCPAPVNPVYVTLTVNDSIMGTTSPTPGSYVFSVGDSINAIATANEGYQFDYWIVSMMGMVIDSVAINPISLTLPSMLANMNFSIVAHFSATTVPNPCLLELPLTYGFEASEGFTTTTTSISTTVNPFDSCWRNEETVGTTGKVWGVKNSVSYAHNGSQSLMLSDKTSGTTTLLAFPPMNFTGTHGTTVGFWLYRNGSGTTMEGFRLYANTTDTITADAIDLGFYSRNTEVAGPAAVGTTGWYYYEVNVNLTGTVYLLMEGHSFYGNATYVDDIEIYSTSSCPRPTDLAVGSMTAATAAVSWTPADPTQNSFTVAYGTGTNPNLMATVASSTASATLTGLTPNTDYHFFVRANCSDENSAWSLMGSFHTPCLALSTSDLPFTENFDNLTSTTTAATGVQPPCWTLAYQDVAMTASTQPQVYYSSSNAHSGSYSLRLYYRGIYALPAIDTSVSALQLSFWVKQTSANYQLSVGVMSDLNDETTFVPVDTIVNTSTSLNQYHEVNFTGYAGNGRYIAFRNISPANYSYSYNYIDDVTVDLLPNCAAPANVAAAPLTTTSALVTWTPISASPSFVVAYGSGTDPDLMATVTSTSASATLTGLTPETSYNVYVKALCGSDEQSVWSQPGHLFTGYCQPAPTSVDGQGIANVTFGSGTETVNNSLRPTSAPYYGNYHYLTGGYAAGSMAQVDITYATGYTYGTVIWVDWDNNLSFDGDEVVYVGTSLSTNPTTLSATFAIPATTDTGTYRMRIAGADSYYDSYTGSIAAAANANPCPTSSYTIVHDYSLHVSEAPSCSAPYNVAVSNIAAHTATVSWTPADSTNNNFRVIYVDEDYNEDSVAATGTSITLTGLSAATGYNVYVRALCSATDISPLSSTTTFYTLCDAIAVTDTTPFVEQFETTSATLDCWTMERESGAPLWTLASSNSTNGYPSYGGSGLSAYCNGSGTHAVSTLISPVLDLTGSDSATLSFVYLNPDWAGDQNELTVKYRNGANGTWVTLGYYNTNVTSWTPVTLSIPTVSSALQVAFFADDEYGYCVGLDSVVVAPAVAAPLPLTITLATADSTMGTTSPAPGTYSYYVGDTLSLAALPNTGYHFVNWSVVSGPIATTDTHSVIHEVVPALLAGQSASVTANFAANTYAITAVANNSTMGTVTGGGTYNYGATATLTATAAAHHHFVQWNDGDTHAVRTVTVTGNATYTATFAIDQHTLTVTSSNSTLGTVTGGGTYSYGAIATLTATAATSCRFVQWNDGDTHAVRTVTVTGNATYTATFARNPLTVTLAINNSAMGSTTPAAGTYTFNVGDTMTATATPATGHHFVNWNVSAGIYSYTDTHSVITEVVPVELAGQSITVTANFAVNTYTLTVLSNNDAMGTVTGGGTYNYGTAATLTATAAEHYHLVQWNDGDTHVVRNVTVTGDATYTATFAIDMHTIEVTANDDEMGYVEGAGTYAYGTDVEISATANEGFVFAQWDDGDTHALRTITVTSDMAFEAQFTRMQPLAELHVVVNDSTMGYVLINGEAISDYYGHIGDVVTLTAVPTDASYRFVGWEGTDQSLVGDTITFTLVADNTIVYANFEYASIGIDDVEVDDIILYSERSRIVVRGAEQQTIRVYDAVGRLVAQRSHAAADEAIAMPATGVYLVQVGDKPARRVVVRR